MSRRGRRCRGLSSTRSATPGPAGRSCDAENSHDGERSEPSCDLGVNCWSAIGLVVHPESLLAGASRRSTAGAVGGMARVLEHRSVSESGFGECSRSGQGRNGPPSQWCARRQSTRKSRTLGSTAAVRHRRERCRRLGSRNHRTLRGDGAPPTALTLQRENSWRWGVSNPRPPEPQ
jgi:hypothetical protein